MDNISLDGFDIDDNGKVIMVETIKNKQTNKEYYNPHSHRNIKHPTTFFNTLIHLLNASLGTGILAMPNAFNHAGYAIGTIGTLLIGMLCTYATHLLVSASYELSSRRKVPYLTYPDTAAAAFEEGPKSIQKYVPYTRFFTNFFLIFYQIGSSCVYVVFISSNIKAVADSYSSKSPDVRMYMIYILLPLILISWIRNLKLLTSFSYIANILTILSLTGIFYYIFRETPSLDDRDPIGSINTIPRFFGTVFFAMEAIGVILPLENKMANPQRFVSRFGVLNMAMVPISILYTLVGFFGYIKYGQNTTGSITLVLPPKDTLSRVIKIMLVMSIYIFYALSNHVTFDIMWQGLEKKLGNNKWKTFWDYVLRTSIVMITFVLAVAVPNLEMLISLIGSLCLPFAGICLPTIISFLTFSKIYQKKGNPSFFFFCLRNLIIVLVSVFVFMFGVFINVSDIIYLIV